MSAWAIFIAVCAVLVAVCIGIAIWTAADDKRRWKRTTATRGARGDSWGDRPPHETRPGRIDQTLFDLEALYNQPAYGEEEAR